MRKKATCVSVTGSHPSYAEFHQRVKAYCEERPDLTFCSCDVRGVKTSERDTWVYVDSPDKRCPELFWMREISSPPGIEVIPYFGIREGPDRQIVSYSLGTGLCNLAEVKEVFGRLFSRYCGSYELEDLPQRTGALSKIALWVHDCLTEDFDHQISLNRQNLEEGVCISYDFGMAFANHYFPPFYTMELGISDDSIRENRGFLIDLITRYARWVTEEEGALVRRLEASYPQTCHGDRCRYYLRHYRAHFATRLYFGRFFEKIRNTPLEKERLREVAGTIGLDLRGIADWESILEWIRSSPRGRLDLKGLDLSKMDLRRADLRWADLTEACLAEADLEGADMRGASLKGLDLRGANLKNVKMDTTP